MRVASEIPTSWTLVRLLTQIKKYTAQQSRVASVNESIRNRKKNFSSRNWSVRSYREHLCYH